MSKRIRQYLGIVAAVFAYYIIHEGAHLIYALAVGAFKEIKFMGIGMQIDVFPEKMSDTEMCIFCLLGAIATFIAGAILILLRRVICKSKNKPMKAIMYYITLTLLLLDPLYLSAICGFFGGGDMNGISLLIPELYARIGFGILLIVNITVFWKIVLPEYKKSFSN